MICHALNGNGHFFFGLAFRISDTDAGEVTRCPVVVGVTDEVFESFLTFDAPTPWVHSSPDHKKAELAFSLCDDLGFLHTVGVNICRIDLPTGFDELFIHYLDAKGMHIGFFHQFRVRHCIYFTSRTKFYKDGHQ